MWNPELNVKLRKYDKENWILEITNISRNMKAIYDKENITPMKDWSNASATKCIMVCAHIVTIYIRSINLELVPNTSYEFCVWCKAN